MFNFSNYKTIIGKHIKGVLSDILDITSQNIKNIPDDKVIPSIRKDVPLDISNLPKVKNCPIYFIENRHNINNKEIYNNFGK